MRILVTGSREYKSWSTVAVELEKAAGNTPSEDVTVVHGGARGADTFAHEAALTFGFTPEVHRADWAAPCRSACNHGGRRHHRSGNTYCPAAGDYRNQEMVDAGTDVCLAFYVPGLPCVGTHDCDRRAVKAGIPVTRIGVS